MTSHSKIQIVRQLFKNSVNNATPRYTRLKKRRIYDYYKAVYLNDKVQVMYTKDSIVIEDESPTDHLIGLTFNKKDSKQEIKKRRCRRKNKKPQKLFYIGVRKVTEAPKSLHDQTGEFYECNCMEKPAKDVSETDSNKQFVCSFCGTVFQNVSELVAHESQHQYYCKLCNRVFTTPSFKEHIEQHFVRIYVCHLCGFEFFCKDVLLGHLGYHFEQQTFENILNMEQDYNMYGFCNTTFSSGDYHSNINNILFFLTYPYDHLYSRNMFMKVVCDICYQEFFIYEYERHMKIAHFLQ